MSNYNDAPLNLVILGEEAAEVVQSASKCLRFGLDDFHPKNKVVNRILLAREIGNLLEMVSILINQGVIDEAEVITGRLEKAMNLEKWYHFPGSMLQIDLEKEK